MTISLNVSSLTLALVLPISFSCGITLIIIIILAINIENCVTALQSCVLELLFYCPSRLLLSDP